MLDRVLTRVVDLPTWLLSRANARAQEILQRAFSPFELRPVHYRTLAVLDEHGGVSQVEIGRHLDLDRKDVAVALDNLSARQLVRRGPDPTDGRRNIVNLTDTGRELLPQLEEALAAAQRDVVAPLSGEEWEMLVALLRKLQPSCEVVAARIAGDLADPATGVTT